MFGFIDKIPSLALIVLLIPIFEFLCIICLCKLDNSTLSSSIIPIVPTPAAARYNNSGDPSPPAPITSTFACINLFCPFPPTCGSVICLAYRWISSSVKYKSFIIFFV